MRWLAGTTTVTADVDVVMQDLEVGLTLSTPR
jgi:hypothetical protein